jgi:hypothetical protein
MRLPVAALAATLALALGAPAQNEAGDEKPANQVKYEKKLEKPFVSKISWVRSLEEARKKAATEKKLIFGYFSRSYNP